MPRVPNDACSRCAKPVFRGPASSPLIICHDCRRLLPKGAQLTCPVCSRGFARPDVGQVVPGQTCCSKSCAKLQADQRQGLVPRRGRSCEVCGCKYDASRADQRTCGRACGAELQRRNDDESGRRFLKCPSSRIYFRNCARCGVLFVARHATAKCCTAECRRLRLIDQVLDRHYGYVQTGMREETLREYLMKRDRGRCGICRKPVRATSGPMRPSIDHIWPRSLGGSDDLENLQLAHYRCNLSKHNKVTVPVQLLLVG